jgi:hypothetical protein
MTLQEWPILRGQTLKRTELHSLVGGAQQWGITSYQNGLGVLIFANPLSSRRYGYDKWEGQKPSGVFDYTGQGRFGDQNIEKGANRTLLATQRTKKPIRLFVVNKTDVTYLGKYKLADDPFRYEFAPDESGLSRRVVVFSLVPVE